MTVHTVLPDPTADLHWSDFRGAIQDIFTSNAERHPQRLCVIETASVNTPQREFTYRQIKEASNVLAWKLIDNGIQRGEVVMIYAYRGVDLVVAVMGVLKSGAAFSVVDPLYPPDRQQIYLDVARPRALVVIDKASTEEGKLSSSVRSWIKENLKLRTEVPGLELFNDGSLRGGPLEVGAVDVLQEQQARKDKNPNVLVGPDTQPTLSFTSGSEGIPKGCKYVEILLSGIAHDPIQRDIFTPLYLGAKIIIPAKADIQHGLLAGWMKTHQATVTHLTPAMGQILVGEATSIFPDLHHAFFVGDVLIKRDCRLLQNLAPNCRIVNMFGTTETQRAVSYFEIPSRVEGPTYLDNLSDIIPAGKGMKDVQLLVVDRDSLQRQQPRLCDIDESGEIYVRAAGLAEGYLGSDDLSRQKFIPNFFLSNPSHWTSLDKTIALENGQHQPWREFYNGPRDRLYRTGDLGKYTEDGNVVCTGRADNQVKIHGFRIELGEIDTHLSRLPNISQNITLLRRNRDEEPTIVSYFVPDMEKLTEEDGLPDDVNDDSMAGMLRRFAGIRETARATLRKKLPWYAIPSVFIPLRRFPLNPNGKIDKKVLPYPDAATLAAAKTAGNIARSNFSHTERYVGEIWERRIGIPANLIDLDDTFIDMGGHSMIGQSVLFDLRKDRGISLSMNTLFQNPTLKEFAAVIDAASELKNGQKSDVAPPEADYHLDGELEVAKSLPKSFPSILSENPMQTFLVTGATGFLGAHIVADVLDRNPKAMVYVLVRASSPQDALRRLEETCDAYGIWDDDWKKRRRLGFFIGDLSLPRLGLEETKWDLLANDVDCIIHNGARVHWIHSYTHLKPTNVLSTISLIELCSRGRPKHLTFVSSTAVLDTAAYLSQPEPILESDPLDRSRKGLSNGYGQTKYVSEYLIREAGRRGMKGSIVRPGYITGSPTHGIGPTDDFLLRLLKGSIQLSCAPDLSPNTINLVPVSHCARIIVAASLYSPKTPSPGVAVVQVTPHPQLSFTTYLGALETYGYRAPIVPYDEWKAKLEAYVSAPDPNLTSPVPNGEKEQIQNEPHALLPLFDWVTNNLPADTRSRALDDTNAAAVLVADDTTYSLNEHSTVTEETVGRYLAFMVAIGFIPAPRALEREYADGDAVGVGATGRKELPRVEIGKAQRELLEKVGRAGGK